ncbi:MAG TPA: GAF domain-containing protein [Micromonosporaceae bacterium]
MSRDSRSAVDWAIQLLRTAKTAEDVQIALRTSVRAGVDAQGATVVRLEDDQCYYVDEDAMSPLWKGQRFLASICISGWAMLHDQTVAVPDIWSDSRIPAKAYRPTFVRSLLIVPIRARRRPVGAVGAYWAHKHEATDEEVATLERLADAAGQALERITSAAPAAPPAPASRTPAA